MYLPILLAVEYSTAQLWPNFISFYLVMCLFPRVTDISQKEKSKQRPMALNTVEMLRVASAGLGMGPHHAMQVAERLYTQGYISYPRTETTSYPENFDLV